MRAPGLDQAAERIAELCTRPTDLVTLWQACTDVLGQAVPHYWSPCCYILDPASPLITSHFQTGPVRGGPSTKLDGPTRPRGSADATRKSLRCKRLLTLPT